MDFLFIAEVLYHLDPAPKGGPDMVGSHKQEMLGAHAQQDVADARTGTGLVGQGDFQARGPQHQRVVDTGAKFCGQQVHRRCAHEPGDERRRGLIVDLYRSPELLDPALVQHSDLRGHGHCVDLVVGDVDEGGVQPAVQGGQSGPGTRAQLSVEIGQRLVHEEGHRFTDHGAA